MSLMDGVYLDNNLRRCDALYPHSVSQFLPRHSRSLTGPQKDKPMINVHEECSDLYESLQACSIALMQDGGRAIVPGAAQDGDVVCILEGAIAPCLLRQRRDECWLLVSGDCHIFGDDPHTITASYAYIDSHQSQAETFVLK